MKISVLGTINNDIILGPGGERTESLGGILYNTIALAALMPGDTVAPVAYRPIDSAGQLEALLSGLPNVDLSGLVEWKGPFNQNVLRYISADEREEVLRISVPSLDPETLEVCLDSDLVLFNFVSGFDVPLETAKRFREKFDKTIFLDVHSMTLGIDGHGRRFERNVNEWREWAGIGNVVQMNRREAYLFTGLDEGLEKISRLICEAGPRICLITLGSDGVFVAERVEYGLKQGELHTGSAEARDATGCGDVFSAGFISRFLHGYDVSDSAKEGNRAAALCCKTIGLEDLKEALKP